MAKGKAGKAGKAMPMKGPMHKMMPGGRMMSDAAMKKAHKKGKY